MQDQPPQLENGIVDKRGIAPVLISCDFPTTLSGLSAKEATPGVDTLEIANDCFEGQE
jgi:hypothetical protein